MKGSDYITKYDKKTLAKIFIVSSLILGGQLYLSKQSRKIFLIIVMAISILATLSLSSGAVLLLKKHRKALENRKKKNNIAWVYYKRETEREREIYIILNI